MPQSSFKIMSKSNISFNRSFFLVNDMLQCQVENKKIIDEKFKITKGRFITLLRTFHPTLGLHKKLQT